MSLLGTIVKAGSSFIPVVGPTISGLIPESSGTNVGQSAFYEQRDALYARINQAYGTLTVAERIAAGQISTNVFAPFEHSTISDSPFKNYRPELDALIAMTKKNFPAIYGEPVTTPAPVVTPPGTPAPMPGTTTRTATGNGKIPMWIWIVGGVLLLGGKKLFR